MGRDGKELCNFKIRNPQHLALERTDRPRGLNVAGRTTAGCYSCFLLLFENQQDDRGKQRLCTIRHGENDL